MECLGKGLEALVSEIAACVARPGARDLEIADALSRATTDPTLLEGMCLPCSAASYARHLLHEGDGWCLIAITWAPGQASPIHAHRAWCALSVAFGWLLETHYAEGPDGPVRLGESRLAPGVPAHAGTLTPGTVAHRLANTGDAAAVSLHAYGAPHDALGHAVNRIIGR